MWNCKTKGIRFMTIKLISKNKNFSNWGNWFPVYKTVCKKSNRTKLTKIKTTSTSKSLKFKIMSQKSKNLLQKIKLYKTKLNRKIKLMTRKLKKFMIKQPQQLSKSKTMKLNLSRKMSNYLNLSNNLLRQIKKKTLKKKKQNL